MNIILGKYGCWQSDDAASINFGSKEGTPEMGFPGKPNPPESIPVTCPDQWHRNTTDGMGQDQVNPKDLHYVTSIVGSIRNPDTSHRYTTEDHEFHIYLNSDKHTIVQTATKEDGPIQFPRSNKIVICLINGSGNQWIKLGACDTGNDVFYAVNHLPNEIAWGVLSAIFKSYSNGHLNGTRQSSDNYNRAFVDGRLKKKKIRGQEAYKVEIVPPTAQSKPGFTTIMIGGENPIATF